MLTVNMFLKAVMVVLLVIALRLPVSVQGQGTVNALTPTAWGIIIIVFPMESLERQWQLVLICGYYG